MSARNNTIMDRWAAGDSATQIAEALGITARTVESVVKRARRAGDERATKRFERGDGSKTAELLRLLRADPRLSLSDAARRAGVALGTAWAAASRAGIKRERQPPSPQTVLAAQAANMARAAEAAEARMAKAAEARTARATAMILNNRPGFGAHDVEGRRASIERALTHMRRVAALPPVTDDEAARLIAEHIARRGVTVCPPPPRFEAENAGLPWAKVRVL